MEQRLKDSKKWAEWAPGPKKALLAALTRDQWEAHFKNDHQPFRKEQAADAQAGDAPACLHLEL